MIYVLILGSEKAQEEVKRAGEIGQGRIWCGCGGLETGAGSKVEG